MGVDPFGAPGQFDGAAPYWRVAYEPHWGNSWLEVGTFGMYAQVHPWSSPPSPPGTGVPVTFTTGTFPQTDNYTDLGFDTQYQYQGDNFWVTLRGSYIYEFQKLNASFANGISSNPADVLNEARGYASLAYGNYNRVVLTGQYFTSWGTPDLGFEAGSWSNWSIKLEYDYYGFGTRSVTFIDNITGNVGPLDIKQNIQTVKVGVNLHFFPGSPAPFGW